jgi:hypothetical protein
MQSILIWYVSDTWFVQVVPWQFIIYVIAVLVHRLGPPLMVTSQSWAVAQFTIAKPDMLGDPV